jgi:hypothetical protein
MLPHNQTLGIPPASPKILSAAPTQVLHIVVIRKLESFVFPMFML